MILKILQGDNLQLLKEYPDNYFDAIITDSPYGLSKKQPLLKILQAWITTGYLEMTGKGFMGKTWDAFVPQPIFWKECYRVLKPGCYCLSFFGTRTYHLGTIAMEIAGFEVRDQIDWIFGSGFPKSKASLKPAHEPIVVCRKPGAQIDLNIDECRLGGSYFRTSSDGIRKNGSFELGLKSPNYVESHPGGRYPSNVIIDEFVADSIDEQSGITKSSGSKTFGQSSPTLHTYGKYQKRVEPWIGVADEGGASRYFYVPKACPSERAGSKHPTIKPIDLMRHLVKLFVPKGGKLLDPFAGSGTTGAAAYFENIGETILIDYEIDDAQDKTKFYSLKKNRDNHILEISVKPEIVNPAQQSLFDI